MADAPYPREAEASARALRKIAAARASLDDASREWDSYRAQASGGLDGSFDPATRVLSWTFSIDPALPQDRLETLLRHAFGDARSSMENVLTAIGRTLGLSNRKLRALKMPYVRSEADWHKAQGSSLRGLPTQVRERVRDLQPFHPRQQALGTPPHLHPMTVIARYDNENKHDEGTEVAFGLNLGPGIHNYMTLQFETEHMSETEREAFTRAGRPELAHLEQTWRPGAVVATVQVPDGVNAEHIHATIRETPVSLAVPWADGTALPILPVMRSVLDWCEAAIGHLAGLTDVPPIPDIVRTNPDVPAPAETP